MSQMTKLVTDAELRERDRERGGTVGDMIKLETGSGPVWTKRRPRPTTQRRAVNEATDRFAYVNDGNSGTFRVRLFKDDAMRLIADGEWTIVIDAPWRDFVRRVCLVARSMFADPKMNGPDLHFTED